MHYEIYYAVKLLQNKVYHLLFSTHYSYVVLRIEKYLFYCSFTTNDKVLLHIHLAELYKVLIIISLQFDFTLSKVSRFGVKLLFVIMVFIEI